MKTFNSKGIEWFLRDENLIEVLGHFSHKDATRRSHFVVEHAGKKIFIKFFKEKGVSGLLRNRFLPRGRREFNMAGRLISLSIPTPEPLGYGISDTGSYVIQEWIDGSTFVEAYETSSQKDNLLGKLAGLLNEMKLRRIRHNDLHLNNIIIRNGRLYLVDLHKMQIKSVFLPDDEISNLAHAITMVYQGLTEEEKEFFFSQYGNKDIRERLEGELKKLRHRWIFKKMNRAFDNTSVTIKDNNCVYIAGSDLCGKGELLEVIKEDKKVKIERYSNQIRKTYRGRRRLNKAWKNHIALAYLNLNLTPRAFFLKKPSLTEKGFIAMEDLGDKGEELDRYLDRTYDGLSLHERKDFINRLSAFMVHAAKQWVLHRDMKACNIFVLQEGGFVLLDAEDIIFREMDADFFERMLVQLNTTVPRKIAERDRIRFFLKLSKPLGMKNGNLFRSITRESLSSKIVYEGVSGLRIEDW